MNQLNHLKGSRSDSTEHNTDDTLANNNRATTTFITIGQNEPEYAELDNKTNVPIPLTNLIANVQANRATKASKQLRIFRPVCGLAVIGALVLVLLSVAVLVLAVAVAWHQWEIRGLKTGLNQTAESGNYYGDEIDKLRDELITLRVDAKRLHKALETLANSSGGGKFDLPTSNKLDYAKLDALNDENRDKARQEAFEMITPFKNDPQYNSDPEFLRRLATVQYFDAMKVLEQNPNAKNAALQSLVNANVSIYKAYGLSTNKTALLYKWMGVIEGKYGTLNLDLKIPDRVRISLRAYKWLKLSADLNATDPGTFYALGNWHYKVTSLSGIEKTIFNSLAGSAKPETGYAYAVQSYDQSVTLYEKIGRNRIGAYIGLARALYKRNSGDDRTRAQEVFAKATAVVPVSADDRLEKDDLKNGIDFVPK